MTTREALDVLKAHLRALHAQRYPTDDYGDAVDADGWPAADPSPAGDIARGWARQLLEEAHANGQCGCLLCRG
jgi:hypothetical protein